MRSGTHTTAGFAARLAADGLLLGSPGTAAAGARGAAIDPAGDPRHDARRRHRAGREGHRDAGVQRACRARAALPAGIRDGPGNPAFTHLDVDGPVSRRPRRARERAVSRRGSGAARRVARTRRLSNGRVRLVVRAVAPLWPVARLRALRRRAAGRRQRARRGSDDRQCARLPGEAGFIHAAVPLGPLLRSPRTLRTAVAIP